MKTQHYILVALVLAALAVVVFFGYRYYQSEQVRAEFPPDGTIIAFSDGFQAQHYTFADQALSRIPDATREGGIVVYEEIQSPLSIEEKIILASDPELGDVAGIAKANGRITLLMSGGTAKSELVARANLAVITSAPKPDVSAVQNASVEGGENDVEETYTSDGQIDIELPVPPAPGTYPELFLIELDNGSITSLGAGRSARFADDTTVIALAQNGIVRIDLTTFSRTLVLEHQNAMRGALSPSGTVALIPSGDGSSFEFYRLGADSAEWLGILTRNEQIPFRAAFPDEEHFFLHTSGSATAWYYNAPTAELPTATRVALFPIFR